MTISTRDENIRPLDDWGLQRGMRRKITVDQFQRMFANGELGEGEPWELVDGQILYKDRSATGDDPMSVGKIHAFVISALAELAAMFIGRGRHLRIQLPVYLPPYNHPEPDGAIVRGTRQDELERSDPPGCEDILCLIEVSDSSLRRDTTVKLREYATTGVAMYVIINIPDRQAVVMSQPIAAEGRYAQEETLDVNGVLNLPAGDGTTMPVKISDLLPAS